MGKLTLRGCAEIPEEAMAFAQANTVKILDASNNPELSSLPNDFAARFPDLERAFFSNCGFDEVPAQLRGCDQLVMLAMKFNGIKIFGEDVLPLSMEWLILTGNNIETLPRSIGDLTALRKVALAGNPLTALPDEMKNCRNIELLRISAANMNAPTPQWMFELPKLAWFSDGGNPASRSYPDADKTLLTVAWDDIAFGEQIGESPSSVVSKAHIQDRDEAVAVKVFKAGLASDGYARDDYMCSILAGSHPNLSEVMGCAVAHPEGRDVIITKLIPKDEYHDLGKPPNFETVTRDTYDEDVIYEPWFVQSVLLDIAQAMVHLHQRGLSHGDLYAHNIQVNEQGHAIVGDFGAASYFEPDAPVAYLRRRQDVLAFGYLVEELLHRMDGVKHAANLTVIRQMCQQEDIERRPGFKQLAISLEHMG